MSTQFALPDCPADIRKRVEVELLARTSPAARDAIIQRCTDDVEWFVDFILYTFDTRETTVQHDLPFMLYDFQREYLRWLSARLTNHEKGIVEKSREMGVTWVTLAFIFHGWLFRSGFSAHLGSYKEEEVDNFERNSLFGKIDYFLEFLPPWLLPKGFVFKRHRHERRLRNPANSNLITGESSNVSFGRSKRSTIVFMDEGAFWPDFERAWRGASETSPTCIVVSTSNGMEAFGRLRHNKSLTIPILTLHWTLHPLKDQAWYEMKKLEMTELDIARELDISYEHSVAGVVYPGWRDVPLGAYEYHPKWPLYVSMDFGIGDDTAMIWAQRDPLSGRIRLLESYSNRGKAADFYIPFITGEFLPDLPHHYTQLEKEIISRHATWGQPIVFGDPAGNARSQVSGESIVSTYRKLGVHVVTKKDAQHFPPRWNATQLLLRDMECRYVGDIRDDYDWDCAQLNISMLNYRFPESRPDANNSRAPRPIHNAYSHLCSALEYLCVNLPKRQQATTRPEPIRTEHIYDKIW